MTTLEDHFLQKEKSRPVSTRSKDLRATITQTTNRLKAGNIKQLTHSAERAPDKVWMMTTYPPRECGIATFSQDLLNAMKKVFADSLEVSIAAIDKENERRPYPREVDFVFHSCMPRCYKQFVEKINGDFSARALVVQHEFGLFPDQYQDEFLNMLHNIKKPVLIVMHTVLPNPDSAFRHKVIDLVNGISKVIVMTKLSSSILQRYYDIPADKIEVIAHGTHLVSHHDKEELKNKYGLAGRTVLSTFGLISRNKNIETSLEALPAIVKKYPEVIFLILGRTHPEVLKDRGEEYREELGALVAKHSLQDNVKFINKYLSLEELLEYLQATDIYLFTSKDPGQAVSGTFSYAMSAGCAMVSTPIPHAKELLENGAGLLFGFEDPASLREQLFTFLDDDKLREDYGWRALQSISGTAWENVANKYLTVIKELSSDDFRLQYRLPKLDITHMKNMTTETGMVQFAKYQVPDPSSGYTLDDNARALLVATMLYHQSADPEQLKLVETYLNFLESCQLKDGSFINYKHYDGTVSNENQLVNLADSNGRAIWALGYLVSLDKYFPTTFVDKASRIIRKSYGWISRLDSPRAIAFTMKGLCYFQKVDKSANFLPFFNKMATHLSGMYRAHSERDWNWFEPYLTYANSALPEAMLIAAQFTGKENYRTIAKESFDFLLSKMFGGNCIKVISNKGWLHKGKECGVYGEQPIDVAYTMLALDRFYSSFGDEDYADKLKKAYNWFLGENHLRCLIYNSSTGGCFDGLEESGANLNQGAESTLSHLIARLVVHDYYLHDNLIVKADAVVVANDFSIKNVI